MSLLIALRAGGAILALSAAVPLAAQEVVPPPTPNADALAAQMRVLGANPRDVNALVAAGELSTVLGDPAAALGFFARAEAIAAADPRIAAGKAGALVLLERPGEALRLYDQAERAGLAMDRHLSQRGLAYDLIGQPRYAQRDYRRALARGDDDETVRRLALSLGISGRRDEAMTLLDPLLRRNDRGAWRARACILAISGDLAGAQQIATGMIAGGAALTPFFGKLRWLSPADRAFAVHFGETGASLARANDARLAPALAVLPEEAAPLPSPVAVASSDARSRDAAPRASARASRAARRVPIRVGRERSDVADAGPVPSPTPPTATPRARASGSAVATRMTAPTARVPQTATSVASAPPAPRAPSLAPAVVAVTPAPLPAAALPPAGSTAAERIVRAASAVPLPPADTPAPVTLASGTIRLDTPWSMTADAATTTVARAATVGGSAAFVVPATTAEADPVPSPSGGAAVPAEMAAGSPGPAPAATLPAATVPAATVPAAIVPAATASTPMRPVAPPIATPTSTASVAGAGGETASSAPVTAAPRPGRTPDVARRNTEVLAAIIETISIPASELDVAPPVSAPPPPPIRRERAEPAARAEATPARPDPATREVESAAAKAESARKPAPKAARPGPAKADPARWWVQVAGGARADDLDKDWRRLAAKSPVAFRGKSAWTTPLRATNRLLAGPFKSQANAMVFVNALAKDGSSSFAWQSEAGQKIEKLDLR